MGLTKTAHGKTKSTHSYKLQPKQPTAMSKAAILDLAYWAIFAVRVGRFGPRAVLV